MKVLILLVSLLALGLGLAIAIAGPGAGWGLWEFPVAFKIYGKLAPREALFGIVEAWPVRGAAALAVLGGVLGFVTGAPRLAGFALLCAAIAVGSSTIPLKMRALAAANPVIHDITTDFDDPPMIVTAAGEPRSNPPEYLGDDAVRGTDLTVSESQRLAFPDIAPIETTLSVEDAAVRARDVIQEMGMKLLSDGPIENGGWRVEAAYTSTWFGFIDDFVVRVTPAEGGSVVNVRSKSRVGGSDLGANAERVRAFTKKFKASLV